MQVWACVGPHIECGLGIIGAPSQYNVNSKTLFMEPLVAFICVHICHRGVHAPP